jgi:ATP-dependent 26S proteasome regulatory subunit
MKNEVLKNELLKKDIVSSEIKICGLREDDNDQVNLSCFLNILDGIIELHGVMIIMTTNFPEKIDAALIRPGRFDFKHEFKRATKNIILEMLKFKYELSDRQMSVCNDLLIIKDEVLSPAEIQSICFKNDSVYDAINEMIIMTQNNC